MSCFKKPPTFLSRISHFCLARLETAGDLLDVVLGAGEILRGVWNEGDEGERLGGEEAWWGGVEGGTSAVDGGGSADEAPVAEINKRAEMTEKIKTGYFVDRYFQ